jgi:WD40 repeat protein
MKLCVGEVGGGVQVWDVRTGRQVLSLEAHTEAILDLAISADAKTLVTGGSDGTARLWPLEPTHHPPVTLLASSRGIDAVALSPDGRRLAVATAEDTVKLWDLATFQEIAAFQARAPATAVLAFLPDGNTLALCGEKGVYVWRAPSWAEIHAAEARLASLAQPP